MYTYTADARHGHVTPPKVRELHKFATPQRLDLLPLRKPLCTVAESPEVLKPKKNESVSFLNRLVGGLPFGFVFSWDLQVV